MAKLNGVEIVSDDVIVYEGARYVQTEEDARVGDIVNPTTNEYADMDEEDFFLVTEARCGSVGFLDRVDDARGIDDFTDSFPYSCGSGEVIVYRKVPLPTAELIEKKRAELAELEAQLAEENTLKAGDWAVVIDTADTQPVPSGTVVRVKYTDNFLYPIKADLPFGIFDRTTIYKPEQLRKLTSEEAKATLISQVEALFNA